MGVASVIGGRGARRRFAKRAFAGLSFLELEMLRKLPLPAVMAWLRSISRLRWHLSRRDRLKSQASMAPFGVGGSASADALAREHLMLSLMRRRLKYLIFSRDADDHRDLIEIVGFEHLEKAVASGRGAVLLASHLGLPQTLRWFLRTTRFPVLYLNRIGFPRQRDPVRRFVESKLRARHRVDADPLLGDEPLDIQFLKKAHDHLRRGGLAFIAADGREGTRPIPVTIRGHEALIHPGGLSLGLLSGADVLPSFSSFDRRGHFHIEIQPALRPPEPVARPEQLEAMAHEMAARIEAEILARPTSVFRREYLPERDVSA
jgi:KDO2-lipid IV(A) lauroyltransferase